MMKLTINAVWSQSDFGYIVGEIVVTDENNNQLMHDEDMYWNESKFWAYVKKTFVENKRFNVIDKPKYFKVERRLEIIVEDLKGAKE